MKCNVIGTSSDVKNLYGFCNESLIRALRRSVLPSTANSFSSRSRETCFVLDDRRQPRVISIVGGKLTVYRKTAAKVMHLLQQTLAEKIPLAQTEKLQLKPVD